VAARTPRPRLRRHEQLVCAQYWLTNYRYNTGITLSAGQTVRITFELTANRKTDDGSGYKFEAGEVMTGGSTCTVTGV
jgi:hypothetical protein